MDQFSFDFNQPEEILYKDFFCNFRGNQMRPEIKEMVASSKLLDIFTGYSTLEQIVEILGSDNLVRKQVRLLFGSEEFYLNRAKTTIDKRKFKRVVEKHWLKEGISLFQYEKLICLITALENGQVRVRLASAFHGKVYSCENICFIGSSNFTYSGLVKNREVNLRLEHNNPQWDEFVRVKESLWKTGDDFTSDFLRIAKSLLRKVTWQECLSLALGEILESRWLERYPELLKGSSLSNLWPSQRLSVGKALYILDQHGALLLADATGSGKTRTVAALKALLLNRYWRAGKGHLAQSLIICPKVAEDNWQRELDQINTQASHILSMGLLGGGKNIRQDKNLLTQHRLRSASLLFLDEVHNYYGRHSKRAKALLKHGADHVMMITATPINKEVKDIFRLLEIMDLDHLSDSQLHLFKKLYRRRHHIKEEHLIPLKEALGNITVRHTKKDLNQLIEKEPSAYKNALGVPCRFPRQVNLTYGLEESARDIALAGEIAREAHNLKGIIRLLDWSVRMRILEDFPGSEVEFLRIQTLSAAALSHYQVMAALRSSKGRILEHLWGTERACELMGWKKDDWPHHSNDGIIPKLKELMDQEYPIKALPEEDLLGFLQEEHFYDSLHKELLHYEKISSLAMDLEDSRQKKRLQLLKDLRKNHQRILAFDSRLISLTSLSLAFDVEDREKIIILSSHGASRRRGEYLFGLESTETGWIGLCSDAVSESINLQGADVLVQLELPSVLRIAEQRIGRIDRLNSPYENVHLYWPDDHPAFALKKDRKLYNAYDINEQIFGNNITIPEALYSNGRREDSFLAEDAIQMYAESQKKADEQHWNFVDAFASLRDLVSGDRSVFSNTIYTETLQNSDQWSGTIFATIKGRCNLILLSVMEEEDRAPSLLLYYHNHLIRDFDQIAQIIRKESKSWGEEVSSSTGFIKKKLKEIGQRRWDSLPNKSRRALGLLQDLLKKMIPSPQLPSQEYRSRLSSLYHLFQDDSAGQSVNWRSFARHWIETLRPVKEEIQLRQPRALVDLTKIHGELRKNPPSIGLWEDLWNHIEYRDPLSKRIRAALIVVGEE